MYAIRSRGTIEDRSRDKITDAQRSRWSSSNPISTVTYMMMMIIGHGYRPLWQLSYQVRDWLKFCAYSVCLQPLPHCPCTLLSFWRCMYDTWSDPACSPSVQTLHHFWFLRMWSLLSTDKGFWKPSWKPTFVQHSYVVPLNSHHMIILYQSCMCCIPISRRWCFLSTWQAACHVFCRWNTILCPMC